MKSISLLIIVILCGCSVNVPSHKGADEYTDKNEKRATTIPVEIKIDTSDVPLGAYTIILRYDQSLLYIDRIEPGSRDEFSGTPIFDEDTFTKGSTMLTSFTVKRKRDVEKLSTYHIATVFFKPRFAGKSNITAEIKTLSDIEANRIQGRIFIYPELIDTRAYLDEK